MTGLGVWQRKRPSYARLAELRRAYFARFEASSALCFGEVGLAIRSCRACEVAKYGQGWIRTSEGVSQQIYSLPRLAASVPTRNQGFRDSPFAILGLRLHTALNS